MGCSQGKTTEPSVSRVSATRVEPPPTPTLLNPSSVQKLLKPSSAQKLKTKANAVVGSSVPEVSNISVEPPLTPSNPSSVQMLKTKADEGVDTIGISWIDRVEVVEYDPLEYKPTDLESTAAPQASDKDWPLHGRALRVFAMADKGKDGLLNAKELADGTDMIFVEMMQFNYPLGLLSMAEWLESVKKLAQQDEVKAGVFLDLCLKHISKQKEHWPLRDEALQVFRMGDRNGDGQLDMSELTEIRRSAAFAKTMMDSVDINKDGTVSKGEWLAYIKRLADQDEKSAAAVLALYRKQLSNSSNTAEAYVAAKSALDALVDDSSVVSARPWWACY